MNYFKNHNGTKNPSAIWVLIGLNTLVFLLESYNDVSNQVRGVVPGARRTLANATVESTQLVPFEFVANPREEWPTLISSMFTHANFPHLMFNMLSLYQFGRPLNSALGPWKVLLIYFLGGIGSNVIYTLRHKESSIGLVGASGAISAVMAAYFLAFAERGNLVTWGLFQVLGLLLAGNSNVSFESHIWGSLIGILVYWMVAGNKPSV